MATLKLSEAHIAAMPLPPPGKNRIDRDTQVTGLGIRITSSGHRGFLFCYRFDSKERRLPIGEWIKGESTLTWARSEAAKLKLKVQSGTDPDAERRDAREAREQARQQSAREASVAQLAARYIAEHAVHKRSGRADERRIERWVLPAWGTRKVKDVTRADCRALIYPVAAGDAAAGVAPRPAEAQHVLSVVRKMFSFALEQEVIDQHPCLGIKIPGGGVAPRERALTTGRELRALWRMTEPGSAWTRPMPQGWYKTKWQRIHEAEAACLRLMLLTGTRPSEAAELPWSEIDLDAATWTLASSRSKNKRPLVLPLLPAVVEMLRARRNNGSDYVFPGQRGAAHITENRLAAALRKVRPVLARLGIEAFRPHDLRRTVETGMAIAKVPKEYRDRVLNHVDASVGGKHYNMHDYSDEKREALEKWAFRLESLLRGEPSSNVVPFRTRA
ncbi:MAG: tyrosine-type recombinase/integrase [Luteimonas sp.]